ncbi:hypothetical protein ACWOC1_02140 [Enterococcus quebecensis]|uniref:Uncharacterized protein n=1 Tax=Enterococcus quebecensis TaxID=903983 RepID=A0A1E5H2X7_9ENTE|nr:hypothetical protein [Enterococcus quebecensis]OEG19378.1 hypothetical protein BCR23_01445 [Enterococcus quebecensis]OJG75697.1 hypothetical protein RV12_GL000036 [Enterococcus quebecensis]
MKKITEEKFSYLKKKFAFYDFAELSCNSGKEYIVEFINHRDITTFSDLQYGGSESQFNQSEKILVTFLLDFLKKLNEKSVFILNYENEWVVNRGLSNNLYKVLKKEQICHSDIGIETDIENKLVKYFIDSVFKYNSFVSFIFEENEIIITPTDHMDIFICSNGESSFAQINALIRKQNNLHDLKLKVTKSE